MNPIHAINQKLSIALLLELISTARRGTHLHEQLGIEAETFNELSSMNVSELYGVADTPFLDIKVNIRALNVSVQRMMISRNRGDLLDKAISLGASRSIMRQYARMTHNEFNARRTALNIEDMRRRPPSLTPDDYDQLAGLHDEYAVQQANNISERSEHLRCLVHLAERSGIDINRIYNYYYIDNKLLFISEQQQQTKGGNAHA